MSKMNYNDYLKLVEDHLMDYLPEIDEKSQTLDKAMRYSLSAGGKRLRPVLVLAACDFCGGDVEKALPYAMAMEYIHTYSLIHDDLPCVDNDDLRRGKPTSHKVFGEAMAVLAGDGLLNSALEALNLDMVKNIDDTEMLKRRVKAAHVISNVAGCQGMIAGQVADIEAEGTKCSAEMLDYIHHNKTGAMIRGAVAAGAYLGGADEETFADLSKYAANIGLAFQICDDILDVTGTTEELGKEVGHDELTEKSTYPSIFGMEYSMEKLDQLNGEAIAIMEKYDEKGEFFTALVEKLAKRRN